MSHCQTLFDEAKRVIPGGVNSPVRSFNAVGGTPRFFQRGEGAYLLDEDNQPYIDYVGSWGPLILGHCHPKVLSAIEQTIKNGLTFGAPTALEVALAEKITQMMPNIQKIRMINSGTEATMTAIRLARGYTGRNKIIKFAGHYHGHVDALLVQAGSGALTHGHPSSPGIPESVTEDTLIAEFNNLDSVQALFDQYPEQIAAVILEPIAGNMNFVPATQTFIDGIRTLTTQQQSLLIFDEVMTGFRVAKGGAQSLYGVKPDLTTLGKVIGGGLPVGAVGGQATIMDHLSPIGPVYQAGTLSGNPVAMAAGLATLDVIDHQQDFYLQLQNNTEMLINGLCEVAKSRQIPFCANGRGSMFGFYFTENIPSCFDDVKQADQAMFKQFFHLMLNKGIYLAPSAFEAGFISSSHTAEDIEKTIQSADEAFAELN